MILAKRFFWFTRLFIRCGGWVALIPLLIGLMSTIGAITLNQNAARLATDGVPATATVVSKRIPEGSHTTTQERQRPSDDHLITIRFAPQNAAEITAEHRTSGPFYRAHDVGQAFTIRYLPDDPDIRELYIGQVASRSTSSQFAGMIFALTGFAASLWFARTAIRATRARENIGMIIETYVTHRPLWPPVFNRMQYQVGTGPTAKFHKTFIRPIWAYGGLKRGEKTRVAITSQGPYWAKDLFL